MQQTQGMFGLGQPQRLQKNKIIHHFCPENLCTLVIANVSATTTHKGFFKKSLHWRRGALEKEFWNALALEVRPVLAQPLLFRVILWYLSLLLALLKTHIGFQKYLHFVTVRKTLLHQFLQQLSHNSYKSIDVYLWYSWDYQHNGMFMSYRYSYFPSHEHNTKNSVKICRIQVNLTDLQLRVFQLFCWIFFLNIKL